MTSGAAEPGRARPEASVLASEDDPKTPPRRLRQTPGYGRYWWAAAVSGLGDYFTTVAIQVLVVTVLAGGAAQVGLVNAARWLPYLVLGLAAGVMVDRLRRRPVMIAADLARAALLVAIPLLALAGLLSIWSLAGFMMLFGLASLFGDAATQAFLPRLVPRALLTRAHARVDQSAAAAQTAGPALAGGLVSLMGAPFAVMIDAASYLFSALMLLGVRTAEPKPPPAARRSLWREAGEGLSFTYGHRTLAPLAFGTHAWFLCNAVAGAVLAPLVLDTLRLTPLVLGLSLSAVGVGALVGSLMATRLGEALGAGRAIVACRGLTGIGFGVVVGGAAVGMGLAELMFGQLLVGLSMGAMNASEMGYWQTRTPDALQGRVNATRRSINRAMIVVGAPAGGLLADAIGLGVTLGMAAAGFVLGAVWLALTPVWRARIDGADAPASSG